MRKNYGLESIETSLIAWVPYFVYEEFMNWLLILLINLWKKKNQEFFILPNLIRRLLHIRSSEWTN